MRCICIHLVDADDGTALYGGKLALASRDGSMAAEIPGNAGSGLAYVADAEWCHQAAITESGERIEQDLSSTCFEVPALPAGAYVVSEVEAPCYELWMESDSRAASAGPEPIGGFEVGDGLAGEGPADHDGQIRMAQLYCPAAAKDIEIVDTADVQDYYIYHAKSHREFADEHGRVRDDRPPAWMRPAEIASWARGAFSRSRELTSSEARLVAAAALSAQLATAALYLQLAMPLIVVLAASLAGAGQLGGEWAARNVSGYFSSWLLDGPGAIWALSSAYPDLAPWPALCALASAPLAAVIWHEGRLFSTFLDPRNEVLEGRPPAVERGMNRGVMGTARLVTDRRAMEREEWVKTTPMDTTPLSDTGVYLGCWQRPAETRLAIGQLSLAADAIEATVNRARRGRALSRCELPPEPWRAPGWMRPAPKCEAAFVPGDNHTAIFGDTRSGKTRRILLSTIELIHRNPRESSIIFDPKGELYGLLADMLSRMGVEVVVIDMSDPSRSDRYNPLSHIAQRAAVDINEASMLVSELVEGIAPHGDNEGQSRYFNDGARAYIGSAALYVADHPGCPDSQKTLATAARIIDVYGKPMPTEGEGRRGDASFCPWEEILEELPGGTENPKFEKESGARGARDSERQAFVSTANSYMQMFRDPAIADMTSATDHPIEEVATRRQAVFLTIPSNRTAYEPFSTLFLNQAYSQLEDMAKSGMGGAMAGRLPQRVNFICEEICSIPRWPKLANACNIGAGYGIRFFLVIQNKALFDAKYEDESDAILGNCQNKVFIRTGDSRITAPWLSSYLGKYTCMTETRTVSGARFLPKLQESITHSPRERELLTEEELLRWRADYGAILIHKDHACVIPLPDVSRTPTQAHARLGGRWENLEKIYAQRAKRPLREPSAEQRWYPEFKDKLKGPNPHKYTDGERARKRSEFISSLADARAKRLAAAGLSGSGKGGKGEKATWYAWVEPSTGEGWIGTSRKDWADGLAKHDSPLYKSGDDEARIAKWYEEARRRRAAPKRAPAPSAPAQPSLFGEPG